jgi:phosphoribosylformimino-5-aminoimidazole carboxamide ribotide isomerase
LVKLDVVPAVDVLDGRVVRLLRGSFEQVTVYGGDPLTVGESWIGEGATLIHLVDLEGARSGAPDVALWKRFGKAGVPFQVGGGVRDARMAGEALAAGAARVVMGTAAVRSPEALEELARTGRVVAAIDVRQGQARGEGWIGPGRGVSDVLTDLAAIGVERVMVTAIARDGTMSGPDLELIGQVRGLAPQLAIIASGGVGTLGDLGLLSHAGCEAAVVGRALYERRFTLQEALAALSGAGNESPS